jgi:hypothetical protein
MSVAFVSRGGRPQPSTQQIQKVREAEFCWKFTFLTDFFVSQMLDENSHLIQTIQDYQNKGKGQECMQ